jgi:hypothetical protein
LLKLLSYLLDNFKDFSKPIKFLGWLLAFSVFIGFPSFYGALFIMLMFNESANARFDRNEIYFSTWLIVLILLVGYFFDESNSNFFNPQYKDFINSFLN